MVKKIRPKFKALFIYAAVISLSLILLNFVSEVGHARLEAPIQPPSYEQKNPYSKSKQAVPDYQNKILQLEVE